MVDIKNLSTLL